MYIGYMGDVVFVCASYYFITPAELKRSSEARWETHDLLLRKPVSQFKGVGLESLSFKLYLRKDHNIDIQDTMRTLRAMRDTGKVFPLIIGGRPVSQNYWRLNSISEEEMYFDPLGKLIQMSASVQLTEYDDSNYQEEYTKAQKYGERYNLASYLIGGL